MKVLWPGIFIFCLFACSVNKNEPFVPVEKKTNKIVIFPQDSFWLNIKKGDDSLIGLSSLENGADSFEFRLWIDEQLSFGKKLFVVKFENNKWNCQNYFFAKGIDDPETKKLFSRMLNRQIVGNSFCLLHSFEPQKGYQSLLDTLKRYQLKEFPTQSSLDDYHGCCDDGVVYSYEIATKGFYKFCVYENPECCIEKNKMNRFFLNFLASFEANLKPGEMWWPMSKVKTE